MGRTGGSPTTTAAQKASHGKGKRALEGVTATAVGELVEALTAAGVDAESLGSVRSVRISDWEALKKGPTSETIDPKTGKVRITRGATERVPMHGTSIVISPTWETGPRWPVVQPAKPVTVKVPKRGVPLVGTWHTLLFLPDEQVGFRRLPSGELIPFHDPRAIDIAIQVAQAERPDVIVHAGDLNDFAPFSRHRQEPGFAMTVQPAIQYAYEYLAILSEMTKDQRVISGNHDIRLQNYVIDNAGAAFALTRAKVKNAAREWPVLSLENLLRLDEIGVEYVGAYPAGATYINDNLAAIHGSKIGNANRTAAQIVVEDERVSILYGHTHKRALAAKTRNNRGRNAPVVAHSPGCLCRVDGAVPSTKGQIDAFGEHVTSFEDWQQGVTIVRFQDGNGKFSFEEIPIFEGWARHRDTEFTSGLAVDYSGMPVAA